MRNKNFNTKGATNVKTELGNQKNEKDDYRNTEKVFNSKTADVIRDESKWDAFQLVGDTNAEEASHYSNKVDLMSKAEEKKVLDRGLAFRMGRKIRMALEAEAA